MIDMVSEDVLVGGGLARVGRSVGRDCIGIYMWM